MLSHCCSHSAERVLEHSRAQEVAARFLTAATSENAALRRQLLLNICGYVGIHEEGVQSGCGARHAAEDGRFSADEPQGAQTQPLQPWGAWAGVAERVPRQQRKGQIQLLKAHCLSQNHLQGNRRANAHNGQLLGQSEGVHGTGCLSDC